MKIEHFAPDTSPPWTPRSQLAPAINAQTGANAQTGINANFYSSPDWWRLRAAIMTALEDFPEARDNLVRALHSLHAPEGPDATTP